MTSVETSVGRRPVYLAVAAISLGAALVGFAPTFFLPMARQSFHATNESKACVTRSC